MANWTTYLMQFSSEEANYANMISLIRSKYNTIITPGLPTTLINYPGVEPRVIQRNVKFYENPAVFQTFPLSPRGKTSRNYKIND